MNEPTIQLTGNITGDVDLRYTPNGKPVARLNVACNPRRLDPRSGEWIDGTPSFWPCQIWGTAAEHAAESLGKGDHVLLTGRIKASTWTPSEGEYAGIEQRRLDVIIDEIGPSLRFRAATPAARTSTTTRTSTPTRATGDHDTDDAGDAYSEAV